MKKKLLFVLMLLSAVTLISGCTSKKEEKKEENKKADISEGQRETITIKDDKSGYKATFTFDKSKKFKVTKTDTSGKSVDVIIQNQDANIELEFYFVEMSQASYESANKTRKSHEGYKEYTFNKYKGYIYSVSSHNFNFNLLLEEGKSPYNSISLFGAIQQINYDKEKSIVEIFESKDVQDFLNSIEFTKN